jgi:hypothetical protein
VQFIGRQAVWARSSLSTYRGGARIPRPVEHPLVMSFATNRAPNHLGDFRTFFDELLHGFCLDLIARSWEFDVNLSEDSGR